MRCWLALVLLLPSSIALAASEREMVERYCAGMEHEYRFPDATRADCVSASHAIEVDFSQKWAEAIGQALHYVLWFEEFADRIPYPEIRELTRKKAGIILICERQRDTCNDHFVRLYRVVDQFELPVTIWDCDPRLNEGLSDCDRFDFPLEVD